jgi:hypothetical protein
MGARGGKRHPPHPNNFYTEEYFFLRCWGRANNSNWSESGRKECMYFKDWFKPLFPLFLIWLLRKLKLLIPKVSFVRSHPLPRFISQLTPVNSRSQWPLGLRRRSAAARQRRLWIRIPPRAWGFVCCECSVLSGRGLCDELIIRPEESYPLWCVNVFDLETSWMRIPWPSGDCRSKKNTYAHVGATRRANTSIRNICRTEIARKDVWLMFGLRLSCLVSV